MDALHRAAMRVAKHYTASQLDHTGQALYVAGIVVGPTWQQLGDVTKSVWRDKAALKLSGHPCWWSINPDGATTITQAASSLGIQAVFQECLNMSINSKKVAEQLDAISEAFMALAGTFRSGSGDSESEGVDGEAAKPVRGAKSASKPATKPAAKKAQAEQDELSIDDVRTKLKELVEAKGKEKMVEALESVGAGKLADVDESQYQELVDKAQEFIDEEDEPAPAKKAPAKKTAKKAGPTLDDVNEAAKALIAADKPAYLKLSKKLGKPSEMEEDDYATAIAAYEQAMPEEAGEEGDDDLL
ncbi:hypothetical protein P26218_05 [Rhodoferax phage P26218]|uniref:hypothetical protein n=1 Tax=Rhodoferax phage P26218 TaxID=1636270 RepID=UPI0005FEB737|nr:hypothetical protein AXJ08_gp05 [Rhodoferax phage P26218]AKA60308.1 hypothetical protein P26218_05 [Rhodoferax phage P26218]